MIGLLLLYFIGRAFYELAFEYDRSRWGYAILGVAIYYAGNFIGGLILGIFGVLIGSDFVTSSSNLILGLMSMPFALLFCWLFYILLKKVWSRPKNIQNDDSLDGKVIDEL